MKKIISIVLLFILSMSITVSADGYIYTQDGVLHDVETGETVIDSITEYYDIGYELYALKPDKTLWHTMPDKFSFIFAIDNVEKFVAQESPRTCAVIKTDGSLWMWGDNDYGRITGDDSCDCVEAPYFVMGNVKDVLITNHIIMCVTNEGKLYTWGSKKFMGTGEEEGSRKPTLIMENVEKVRCSGTGYYAIKTDGSLWAWGLNMFQTGYKMSPTSGWSIIVAINILGLNSDEYEILTPTRVPVENVIDLSFNEWNIMANVGSGTFHRSTIAYTKDKTYIWGNEDNVFDKAQVVKANSKSLLASDGTLYLWDGTVVADGVSDMSESSYITLSGEIYTYDYTSYTDILNKNLNDENVKCILDYSNGFLYIKNDTTLVKGYYKYEKEVICSNVYDAFYYNNTLFVIDNAYTLYKVEDDNSLTKILDNVTRRNPAICITVNGEKTDMDTLPYIKNDRTMVPMRAIFEALGAEVTWDNETRTAIGKKDGVEIKITIGENVLYKNGVAIELDAVAEITNDRTMVPVRAISEAFEYIVEWDNKTKTVNIIEPYNRLYYIYDESGHVAGAKDGTGNYIHCEYLYDENGNVVRVWEKPMIKNSDRLFEYTYNEKGQMISKSVCSDWWMDALYGGPIDKAVAFTEVEKYFYDEAGKLLYAEYPSGGRRYYIYDGEDKLIREENDKGKIVTKYVYDEDGVLEYKEEY